MWQAGRKPEELLEVVQRQGAEECEKKFPAEIKDLGTALVDLPYRYFFFL